MNQASSSKQSLGFRRFFVRGLAVVLPTILTIWIIVYAYRFVDQNIAAPINRVVQSSVLVVSPWPPASETDFQYVSNNLTSKQASAWDAEEDRLSVRYAELAGENPAQYAQRIRQEKREWVRENLRFEARQHALREHWDSIRIGNWVVLDLIGLVIAILLIYAAGLLLGSYFGRRFYSRGEQLLQKVPLFKQVYPYVKQVTEFLIGDDAKKMEFNRVVALQYPRKGVWSLGLVTGDTMRGIEAVAGEECMTVFVPSSPTPFTGYVVTVPKRDTIELPITIDDALRFTVSGGVIIPTSQIVHHRPGTPPDAEQDESSLEAQRSLETSPTGGKA